MNKTQIDDILMLTQEFADCRAACVVKMIDEYNDMDDEDDLLADEQEAYEALINYLESI